MGPLIHCDWLGYMCQSHYGNKIL